MRDALFHVEKGQSATLQGQIREALVTAILGGQLPPLEPIPSTRAMARRLQVSRNTVVLAYEALVEDGFLLSRERSGFYVNPDMLKGIAGVSDAQTQHDPGHDIGWSQRLRIRPGAQSNIVKPLDWRSHPYLFIYGQMDRRCFPYRNGANACARPWAPNGSINGRRTATAPTIPC